MTNGSDLFGRILVLWELDHLIGHLVDGADDLEHLLIGDRPVAIDVVQLEGPWKYTEEERYVSARGAHGARGRNEVGSGVVH